MAIDNTKDTLNSTDIIERIEELENEFITETEKDTLEEAIETIKNFDNPTHPGLEEYNILKAFASELEGYGDWKDGETLIRESYFEDYCKELCEDIGAIPKDFPGFIEIDWEATANNLRVDYTEAELDGVTYLMRA